MFELTNRRFRTAGKRAYLTLQIIEDLNTRFRKIIWVLWSGTENVRTMRGEAIRNEEAAKRQAHDAAYSLAKDAARSSSRLDSFKTRPNTSATGNDTTSQTPSTHQTKAAPQSETVTCDNCSQTFEREFIEEHHGLHTIHHLYLRLDVGGTVPAGECPECGAFVYAALPITTSTSAA